LPSPISRPLHARVGIATGVVVIDDRPQVRTAVGDAPAMARRLRAVARSGALAIAGSTRRLVGKLFEYRALGRAAADEPALLDACLVLGPSRLASRFEALHADALTPLVGREDELALLLRLWRRATEGSGQVVLLAGEPGIGKSRLLLALQEQVAGEAWRGSRYFCSPHHESSMLHPLIAHLEQVAGFLRDDSPPAKFARL